MSTVDVDGVPIHYEIDGAGAPVVVIHGGLGIDHVLYRRTLAPLQDSCTLVHYDQRGNGRSVPADLSSVTMERLADDVVALADHLELERFSVLGHSYGGFVAQEVALRTPARLSKLALVDTTPGVLGSGEQEGDYGEGPMPPREFLEVVSGAPPATDEEMASAMATILPAYFSRPSEVDVDGLMEGTIFRAGAMTRGFEVLAAWSSVDRLAALAVPTLVLAGRHDVVTSWPQSMRIAARLPGAELVLFEDSGHFPWIEEPDRFFPLVSDWLSAA